MQVLVAYETAHGSTRETAETIADVLRERGAECDVVRCREAESIDGYDAYIVGSAIWALNWLRPARQLVLGNTDTLATAPVAYFCTSASGGRESGRAEVEEKVIPRLRDLAVEVTPVAIGNFGGVINYEAYNLPIRLVMKAILKAKGEPTSGYHDMRDWEQIRAWASEVYDLFAARLAGAEE